MSTSPNDLSLEAALGGVPAAFRSKLIKAYVGVKDAYLSGHHDAAGLRAGRLCEVLLRLLQQELTGQHVPFGTRIRNFTVECSKLEKLPAESGSDSLRIIMPRALNFLYTMRNKRGIGHEVADIDANEIDAAACVRIADWCVCELIRLFHSLSLEDAQALLDAMAIRQVPEVWSVVGKKRVLDPSLDYSTQTLILLYSEANVAVADEDLCAWTEHGSISDFRRRVLKPLHAQRLIEYDMESRTALISPTGVRAAEATLLRGDGQGARSASNGS